MQNGFTLLELAIVLAIVGLIAGGVVVGQSMVRAAELRAVVTEVNHIRTAVNAFKEKYSQLPGDMDDATRFWGAADANPTNCPTASGTGTETCNGDGDGVIEKLLPGAYTELYMFWQHLSNAGLIEGVYSGKSGPGSNAQVTDDNIFKSKLSGGVYIAFNLDRVSTGGTHLFDGTWNKNYLQFAGYTPATTGSNDVPLLAPEELWGIDKKIDDGKPGYGQVIERHWDDCTDATASSDRDASYLLTEKGRVCLPIFYDIF